MKNTTLTPTEIRKALKNALHHFETIKSELVHKGLASRKSWGFVVHDTRHPRYASYQSAEREYYAALDAAKTAGLITEHNSSFSWNP